MMNARWRYIERLIRDAGVDFDAAQRPGWYHKPFSWEEIAAHPDRDGIEATAKATAEELVKRILHEEFEIDAG
jgi:hypothetical protein